MCTSDNAKVQFIASAPTLFPAEYVQEFQNCFDRAPAIPYSEIEAILREELGRPLENVYEYVDPAPIASASIAQVCRQHFNLFIYRCLTLGMITYFCECCAGSWCKTEKFTTRSSDKGLKAWRRRCISCRSKLCICCCTHFGVPKS